MGLRAFMVRHFGKPVDDTPYSFTEADDAYLERLARQAFSESTITKQPEFHPVTCRRKDQQKRVA